MLGGLPGSGKSTVAGELARRLRAVVVSVDPIEDAIIRSGVPMSFATGVAAYEVGATVAREQLRNGLTVIADAANYLEVGRDMWRHAASDVDAAIAAVTVICSDEALHRSRLAGRDRGLTAYPEPTWSDVQRRIAETEPWPEPVLVVDPAAPLDPQMAQLVERLTR